MSPGSPHPGPGGLLFADREDAARRLATALAPLAAEDPVVLGLPRGGVPVAAVVAKAVGAPLDVVIVRKLGVPWQPELAMGAIGEGGVRVVNETVVRAARVSASDLEQVAEREERELRRRVERFRPTGRPTPVQGRTVVVVDDGAATGATALAACEVVRRLGARRIVVAVPVATGDVVERIERVADQVVCLQDLDGLGAIGRAYRYFPAVPDAEVVAVLDAARRGPVPQQRSREDAGAQVEDVLGPGGPEVTLGRHSGSRPGPWSCRGGPAPDRRSLPAAGRGRALRPGAR